MASMRWRPAYPAIIQKLTLTLCLCLHRLVRFPRIQVTWRLTRAPAFAEVAKSQCASDPKPYLKRAVCGPYPGHKRAKSAPRNTDSVPAPGYDAPQPRRSPPRQPRQDRANNQHAVSVEAQFLGSDSPTPASGLQRPVQGGRSEPLTGCSKLIRWPWGWQGPNNASPQPILRQRQLCGVWLRSRRLTTLQRSISGSCRVLGNSRCGAGLGRCCVVSTLRFWRCARCCFTNGDSRKRRVMSSASFWSSG
jgi:hypothetical protein